MRRNTPRNVGIGAIAVAALTMVAQLIQALGGLPEVMKAFIAQGWYAAGGLAVASVIVLVFQVIRSADAARQAADERAENQYVRMGAMLNEMGETMARIAEAQVKETQAQLDVAQALEGLRHQVRNMCPMIREERTDPLARTPVANGV